jgi:hypothetical protein
VDGKQTRGEVGEELEVSRCVVNKTIPKESEIAYGLAEPHLQKSNGLLPDKRSWRVP